MINLKNVLIALVLPIILATQPAIALAETPELDSEGFIELEQGQVSPVGGLLFDDKAMAKLLANQESKIAKITLEKDTEISKIKLVLETDIKKKEKEIEIKEELQKSLLNAKQERIDLLEKQNKWSNLYFIGGFVVGVTISITIFYAAVQIK